MASCVGWALAHRPSLPRQKTVGQGPPYKCPLWNCGNMTDTLNHQVDQALAQIAAAVALDALEAVRVSLLGKSGLITEQLKALGKLPAEERKAHGEGVNRAKDRLLDAIAARRAQLELAALH